MRSTYETQANAVRFITVILSLQKHLKNARQSTILMKAIPKSANAEITAYRACIRVAYRRQRHKKISKLLSRRAISLIYGNDL